MNNGRSTYNFQLNCDMNLVNNVVQRYLQLNNYIFQNYNNEQCFIAGDNNLGYRFFSYTIYGQNLTIFAWFRNEYGEISVEQYGDNEMAINYKKSLNMLFQEINNLNYSNMNSLNNVQMNYDPVTGQPIQNNYQPANQYNQFGQPVQSFNEVTTKRLEKNCEICFWVSLVGLLLAFFGYMFGIIFQIYIFIMAGQGLKTRKRYKAIASIVISIISILLIIYQVVTGNFFTD